MKKLLGNLKKWFVSTKGFTLIELLIVIAIIGVLAGIVLVAVDPTEQLNRGRDARYFNSVGTLASATQAYLTAQGQTTYPQAAANWQTTLINAGEITVTLTGDTGANACVGNAGVDFVDNGVCYATYPTGVIAPTSAMIWTGLESKSNSAKAAGPAVNTICPATATPAFVWASVRGAAGLTCVSKSAPSAPSILY